MVTLWTVYRGGGLTPQPDHPLPLFPMTHYIVQLPSPSTRNWFWSEAQAGAVLVGNATKYPTEEAAMEAVNRMNLTGWALVPVSY